MKDLRDSFASHLLSGGVQLGYVSTQLGHADVGITARHYARWIESDIYREPVRLQPGEVPADLLSRLESPESPPSLGWDSRPLVGEASDSEGLWRARHDSNVRPLGPQPSALSN